jgi:hypothetical protein
MSGVIDEPAKHKEDSLGIEHYYDALTEFVVTTKTPITIGIQGEWGSGKTSLLNNIWHNLDGKQFEKIWVNTWEHSLMSTPEETLIKIVEQLVSDLSNFDPNSKETFAKVKKASGALLVGAARFGASMVGGSGASDAVKEILDAPPEEKNKIRFLRESLAGAIQILVEKKRLKGFVFFIDDLDRIEPKDAVKILELLKNIFNIKNCIFLLAIDYHVVVKGLKEKFGAMTQENEWEFRAFFDKIIQVPFTMPMGDYDLGKYVEKLLKEIDFLADESEDQSDEIEEIVNYSIGGNPRSLKRLANSLSLINLFKKETSANEDLILMLAVVCLQVAYPKVYEKIAAKPDFIKWDESDVYEFSRGGQVDKDEFERAIKTEDFGQDWEQRLFRMCYPFPQLKSRAVKLSRLMTWILEKTGGHANLEEKLAPILKSTSITSVSVNPDQPKGRRSKGYDNKDFWLFFFNLAQEKKIDLFQKTPKEGSLKQGWVQETVKQIEKPALKYYAIVRCKKDSIVGQFCIDKKNTGQDRSIVVKAMDFVLSKKDEIENSFGSKLEWGRDESKNVQRITFTLTYDMEKRDKWGEYSESAILKMTKLVDAVKGPANEANQQL